MLLPQEHGAPHSADGMVRRPSARRRSRSQQEVRAPCFPSLCAVGLGGLLPGGRRGLCVLSISCHGLGQARAAWPLLRRAVQEISRLLMAGMSTSKRRGEGDATAREGWVPPVVVGL